MFKRQLFPGGLEVLSVFFFVWCISKVGNNAGSMYVPNVKLAAA